MIYKSFELKKISENGSRAARRFVKISYAARARSQHSRELAIICDLRSQVCFKETCAVQFAVQNFDKNQCGTQN